MSRSKIKQKKEKAEKKTSLKTKISSVLSGKLNSTKLTISKHKKKREEKKLVKQTEKEVIEHLTASIKTMADRAALLELAKRKEAQAKELRELAERM